MSSPKVLPDFPKKINYSGFPLPSGRGRRVQPIQTIITDRTLLVAELCHWAIAVDDIQAKINNAKETEDDQHGGLNDKAYIEMLTIDWTWPRSRRMREAEAYMQWIEDMYTWNYGSEDFKSLNVRKFAAYYAEKYLISLYDKNALVDVEYEVNTKVRAILRARSEAARPKQTATPETPSSNLPENDRTDILDEANIDSEYIYVSRTDETDRGKMTLRDVAISKRGRAVAIVDITPDSGTTFRDLLQEREVRELNDEFVLRLVRTE